MRKTKYSLLLLLASPADRRHSKVGDYRLWKMKRKFQFRFLKQVGLLPDDYFLDIGCGTLRGGIPIIQYLDKGHYYGMEVRKDVLEEGKKELVEAGCEEKEPVLIFAESLSSIKVQRQFDNIWAFSVLIHMEDHILQDCLDFVFEHLSPSGHFYANVLIEEGRDGVWQGFPVVHRSLVFYKEMSSRSGLYVCDLGSLLSLGHNSGINKQDQQRMLKFWRSDYPRENRENQ